MSYDTDWKSKRWVVKTSIVSDLIAEDRLTFTGTGAGDGGLQREDRAGTSRPSWGSGCTYLSDGRVRVTNDSHSYTIERDESKTPVELSCTRDGSSGPTHETAASWTAQEGGGGGGTTHRRPHGEHPEKTPDYV